MRKESRKDVPGMDAIILDHRKLTKRRVSIHISKVYKSYVNFRTYTFSRMKKIHDEFH